MARPGVRDGFVPLREIRNDSSIGDHTNPRGGMLDIGREILTWSVTRPPWQRDALRRLFVSGTISEDDFRALLCICKETQGIQPDGDSVVPEPLSDQHLAKGQGAGDAVRLRGIKDVHGVNALAEGFSLAVASAGISVVYGDNGMGKSGYARVLKKACRARGRAPAIHPDIFSQAPPQGPTSTIQYDVGAEARVHHWAATTTSPPELSQISVFDAATATVYAEEKTDVAFRPFGLDVFPKLVAACERLRTMLQIEVRSLGPDRQFTDLIGETPVGDAIRHLTDEGAEDAITKLANLTDADEGRLENLARIVIELGSGAPSKRAGELQLKARRYRTLAEHLSNIGDALSDARATEIRLLAEDLTSAREAARLAQTTAFEKDARWSIGGDPWMRLWNAAHAYSENVAYPGVEFPVTTEGAQCVLCLQPLGDEARARLLTFADFVRQETQRRERIASEALAKASQRIRDLVVGPSLNDTVLAEIASDDPNVVSQIDGYLASASQRRTTILAACETGTWPTLPSLQAFSTETVLALAERSASAAVELNVAQVPEESGRLRREHASLLARRRLREVRTDVLTERERRIRADALRECLRQTETTAITAKNTELTKAGVSDELRTRFQNEMNALKLSHLTVSVEPQYGAKGVAYHQVRFANALPGTWGMRDVLSEGEHRSIALAGFLAELSTQPTPSSVVFDDPVSSLDHVRREVVAARLVKEALDRPVVIFTHDIVFLLLLQEKCEKEDVPFTPSYLTRQGTRYGVPVDGLPWYGMPVKKRIGVLRQEAVRLERLYDTASQEEYEKDAAFLWGRLREAWECGVEEVLLAGAVRRFSRQVSTQPLSKIHDITKADIDAVDRGMTLCSTWMPGHDLAAAINNPMPTPEVFGAAVEDLDAWRAAIVKRRG